MKELIILGNSPAGFACLQILRREGFPGRVVIVPGDGEYPYRRGVLPDVLAKTVPVDQTYCGPVAGYEKLNAQVCTKKIGRVSFKRQRLTTEDKEVIPFDCCLIDEYGWLPPEDIKGAGRNGFLLINRLDHIKAALKLLPQVDTVLVQADSLNGIRTAGALSVWNKEIILVCSQDRVLASFVEPEISVRIADTLEKKGIRVLLENSISEILGDSDAKAARLKSGKILAAQMICVESQLPDRRLFKDTELFSDGAFLPSGENGATVYPNIFITGRGEGLVSAQSASYNSCDDFLQEQGAAVAYQILQKDMPLKPVVSQAEINWPGFQLILLGQTSLQQVGQVDDVYLRSDEATGSYQRFYIRDGVLAGAVLINADLSRYQALSLLSTKKTLSAEYLQNQGFQRQPPVAQLTDKASLENAGCSESARPYENAQNS
ncbi:MAG: FAD-dependent oxidoreductase [Candidatus Omnitrophota bacterium]|jgi:NAD(P)H-nitrite reductase large subunit